MSDTAQNPGPAPLITALCIGREAFDRFGRILRHLVVGLVDQAVNVQLIGSDARIETLGMGPVKTVTHKPIVWPVGYRRIVQVAEMVSAQPPTTVHALSAESYRLAAALADAFDADLVFQVTAQADCEGVAQVGSDRVGKFLAFSDPLRTALETQLGIASDRIALVRPGLLASKSVACYSGNDEVPTLVCTSPFTRSSGVERLIEALRLLRDRGCEPFVFLLGEGPKESALRRAVKDADLSPRVTFAHPAGDYVHAMRGADIFVRPSEDRAFVADGLLAMGAGLAVVTLPSVASDCFRDGETAIVCAKASAECLAEAIERLYRDRNFARGLATAAAAYVREHHAMSGMAERTAQAYRELALSRATFRIEE